VNKGKVSVGPHSSNERSNYKVSVQSENVLFSFAIHHNEVIDETKMDRMGS
jgi:hypothetical protein